MKKLLLLPLLAVTCLHGPPAPAPKGVPVQQRLFTAISRLENCRVWRNPGCLRFAGQAGATRGPGGYARFSSRWFGERALRLQIARGQGQTVLQFLKRYNPQYADYPARVASLALVSLGDVL